MSKTRQISQIDLFKRKKENGPDMWDSGKLVGRPFRISYDSIEVWMPDAWKQRAGGVPQGSFLLAYYDSAENESDFEAILLRVKEPISIPQEQDITTGIIECYQENIQTSDSKDSQIDFYTRYHSSFSGLKCAILGCFYKDRNGQISFGADIDNFYSARNYSIIKPSSEILAFIVNHKGTAAGNCENVIKIGSVRYSSSQRFRSDEIAVPFYIQAKDFAGKRTALFGMTRTGKSNTIKKLIQVIVSMSDTAILKLDEEGKTAEDGTPKYPIGQIIFDINGEYANANHQDSGTAISEMFKDQVVRYSTIQKDGFKMLKVNFYSEVEEGFNLIKAHLGIADKKANWLDDFLNIDLAKPADEQDYSEVTRYNRRLAVYYCCLHRAGFPAPKGFTVQFRASKEVCEAVDPKIKAEANKSITLNLDDAANWWEKLWNIYGKNDVFKCNSEENSEDSQKEWADSDLKALLVMLTRKSAPGAATANRWGFNILKNVRNQHTEIEQVPFDQDILKQLRNGKIVIVDLSLGDPYLQKMFSERITKKIFNDSLERFITTKPNNYIQFYFEEAHNLFPKKDDKDLSQIYNRLAKEGAKLNLGLTYATQEVSSISNNILKATQNWFISHLNNQDEIRELTKYYDFGDFAASLIRFSPDADKGFARVKTYSNAFVVPIQIDLFMPVVNKETQAEEISKNPTSGKFYELLNQVWP